ncbi:MAG: acetate kinase [Candidatus Omnitrophota bacterium]|nr:acetate kinase [bacterium]MBU3930786.1 acetate kinase [bacterium]MBU4123464.1 acetate kinase [bacterium]
MKILVLNSRIYSLEYELLEVPGEKILCSGQIKRIGAESSVIIHKVEGKDQDKIIKPVFDHQKALDAVIKLLTGPQDGVIKDKKEIGAVGHRVVHGGEDFQGSIKITPDVRKKIYQNFQLAPLHNPFNLKAIDAALKLLPGVPQVAVFDTSYYQKMPPSAYYYALPMHISKEHKIRRYGFHGISHQYACENAANILKKPLKGLRIISFHLGQGCSVSAIKDGAPIDTSMGFSPLGGLVMTTRCGNIDPEIVIYLSKLGWSFTEIEVMLNKESGILGLSGVSDNMKDVILAAEKGDERSKLAIDIFCYAATKYFFSYYGILGGANAIIFTGGIGVNSPLIRKRILEGAKFLGIEIDPAKNRKTVACAGRIESKSSKAKILVIPRNEGILIARETYKIIKGKKIG